MRPTCPADVDGDVAVGLGDLLAVLTERGFRPSCAAALDGDEQVALSDLLAIPAWGPCG